MPLSAPEGWNVPHDSPFYPPLPAHYRDVRFHFVMFRADPAAVARLLPEPLEPDPDGRCAAIGIHIPFCTSYGAFDEAAVQVGCTFRGQRGWYCSHVWHTGPAGIAAGREVYGTPKFFAEIERVQEGDLCATTAGTGGAEEIQIRSRASFPARPEELPVLAPSYRLKVIPRADGPGPAIKQLVDGAAAGRDRRVAWCRRGEGTVRFCASPARDLTALAPCGYDGAFHMEASFSESWATIVHDYLSR